MSGQDKDKSEKPKVNSQIKHIPKDAQVVMSILKELNITDYEPRVINQLLEFVYRYVTCILDDAKAYANHARKKVIDMDDVKLATDTVLDKAFTCPPPRHVLAKLAETKNSMPLPAIKPHCGLRLPPDRYCLSACNYKLRAAVSAKKMTKSAIEGRSAVKTLVKPPGAGASTSKRASVLPGQGQVTIPKPVIKFTTAPASDKQFLMNPDGSRVKMDVDDTNANIPSTSNMGGGNSGPIVVGVKRSREDDGFEMVP